MSSITIPSSSLPVGCDEVGGAIIIEWISVITTDAPNEYN